MPARPARWRSGATRWQNSTWWPEAQLAGNLFWARTGDQLQGPPISRKPIADRAWLVRWLWMGSWRSGGLLWSRRTPKLVKEDPKLVKKDPKIGQERPLIGQERPIIGFVFWRNMPNMWVLVALGRCGWHSETFLVYMYYLCNCTMIRSSMMMIIRKLCCLCNPMIQQ